MRVVYKKCAGMDVHKKNVVACVLTDDHQQTRTFRTVTADLRELAEWLRSEEVGAIAMESTGVYWKPVWNVLEEEEADWELLLVNAKHVKQVPGRKTDVKDAEWLAELLRHGLLSASRVPERAQRELRDLTRFRRTLIRERAHEVQRLQKVLESANVKLDSVISDGVGVSGKAMIRAMVRGETDPATVAGLADPRLKATTEQLCEALEGVIGEAHRVVLEVILEHIEQLDRHIERMDQEIRHQLDRMDSPPSGGDGGQSSPEAAPFDPETGEILSENESSSGDPEAQGTTTQVKLTWRGAVELLDGIPGIGERSAQDILAETGLDMTAFPTSRHLTSWAKISPGNCESAGKRRHGRTGKGNKWLKSTLVECSWSAVRVKDCYYKNLYGRLSGRRGAKRAIVAVGRSLLEAIYPMLKRNEPYRELGADHHDWLRRERIANRAVRRLEKLGFAAQLIDLHAAAANAAA